MAAAFNLRHACEMKCGLTLILMAGGSRRTDGTGI